jgi:hypothetical protein
MVSHRTDFEYTKLISVKNILSIYDYILFPNILNKLGLPGIFLEDISIQRPRLAHPRHELRMIPVRIIGIRMDEDTDSHRDH